MNRCLLLLSLALLLVDVNSATAARVVSLGEEIAFMKSASSALIFTVDPDGKRSQPRQLNDEARHRFVAFVSDPANFNRPLAFPIMRPEVGIEFRKGDRTFALYGTWQFGYFYDHFPEIGYQTTFFAVLEGKSFQLAQEWRNKYFRRPVDAIRPGE